MNILYVTLGFPPAEGLGGPVKITYNNARELAKRGHKVTVYCTNLHNKRRKIAPGTFEQDVEGVRVVYLDTFTVPGWPGTVGPMYIPNLMSYLRREITTFDVIHVNGYRDSLHTPVIREALRHKIPYLIQPQGVLTYLGWTGYLKRIADLWLRHQLASASVLLAGSPKEITECRSLGGLEVAVEMIRNGVCIQDYLPLPRKGVLREQIKVDRRTPIALFLGRINWIKGPDILVRSFAHCRQPAVLVIVGPDDGYRSKVLRVIRDLELTDRVKLVGPWSPDGVLEAFVDADVFVMTSRKEQFGMTLVEACIAGTPIVLAETCEIASLLNGTAAVVTPLDETAIATAIDRVLSDRDLRQRMALAGPTIVQREFSIEAVGDRLEGVYDRAIARRKSS